MCIKSKRIFNFSFIVYATNLLDLIFISNRGLVN